MRIVREELCSMENIRFARKFRHIIRRAGVVFTLTLLSTLFASELVIAAPVFTGHLGGGSWNSHPAELETDKDTVSNNDSAINIDTAINNDPLITNDNRLNNYNSSNNNTTWNNEASLNTESNYAKYETHNSTYGFKESYQSRQVNETKSISITGADIDLLPGSEKLAMAFARAGAGYIDEALAYYLSAVEEDDSLLEMDDAGLLNDGVMYLKTRIAQHGMEADILLLGRVLAVRGDIDESEKTFQSLADSGRRDEVAAEARRRLMALRFMSTL